MVFVVAFYNTYDAAAHRNLGNIADHLVTYVATEKIRQPKRLWDSLNKVLPIDYLWETDTQASGKRATLAAFRRGIANNAFMKIALPRAIRDDILNIVGPLRLLTFPDHKVGSPPIEFVLIGRLIRKNQYAPLLEPHRTKFLAILDWKQTFETVKARLVANATKIVNLSGANYVELHITDPSLDFHRPAKGHYVENDIFIWAKTYPFVVSTIIFRRRSFAPQYGKVRHLVRSESKRNLFKWQSLCAELSTKSNMTRMRELANAFGVPPQFWDNPRKVCAIIAPRAQEFLEKVECANADEPTMEGDEVGGIPEFLKYTYVADNGLVYCSNIVDLYKAVKSGQTMDPYRRFRLDKDDITARYDFLKKVINPHGLGEGVLTKIQDTALMLGVGGQLRARLVHVWGKLRYPKFTIEEIMNAGEDLLNGIFAALTRQEGIIVSGQEKDVFNRAIGKVDEKRAALINTMYRIVNIEDPSGTNLVALEFAINDATPQGSTRARDEEDDLASAGSIRAVPTPRFRDDDNDDDVQTSVSEDEYEDEELNPNNYERLIPGNTYAVGDIRNDNGMLRICVQSPCTQRIHWVHYEGGDINDYSWAFPLDVPLAREFVVSPILNVEPEWSRSSLPDDV